MTYIILLLQDNGLQPFTIEGHIYKFLNLRGPPIVQLNSAGINVYTAKFQDQG